MKTAYLNANIDCEIFVKQPQGFAKQGKNGTPLYCRLNKSLYGLKQSGRLWNQTLDDFLHEIGFTRSKTEHCLYLKDEVGRTARLIVFVDDIILAGDEQLVTGVTAQLNKRFKMKDLGDLEWFLDIELKRTADQIAMNQTKYIERLLTQHGMMQSKPVATPCVDKLELNDTEILSDISNQTYRSVVGSLIYCATGTRPDLQWIVLQLSRYLNEPVSRNRWVAVKRVLRYLRGTINYQLTFRSGDAKLVGYSDSD